eukprot:scaffold42670_cov183-Amphora_coffeaeformis.AAC.1
MERTTIGSDDTVIVQHFLGHPVFEGFAVAIRHGATGLLHNATTGGVIPNVLLGVGQAQIQCGVPIGHHGVFGLRIHPNNVIETQFTGAVLLCLVITMTCFETLYHGGTIGRHRDGNGRRRVPIVVGGGY